MKQEIKERIELINKGIVPTGYKKTPVGICPVEWGENTLKNIFVFKNGLNKEKNAFGKGTPIINYTDVWKKRGLKIKDIKGKVTLNKNEIENYIAKKGDVFFTRTSETINEIGLTSVLLEDIANCVFSGFVLRGRPVNNLIVDKYNQYCYSLDFMRNEIIKKSSYTTRALTNGELLSQVCINLPTKPEQEKIAEILDCATKKVELQEQLLDKLKIQKKALIQKLLTPQHDWQKLKLKNIINFYNGYAFKSETYVKNGAFYVITISNVKDDGFVLQEDTSTIEKIPTDIREYQILRKGDVLISMTGNVGRVCKVECDNCLLNQRVGKIEVKKEFDKDFIFYSLQSYSFVEKMKLLAQGAAQDNMSVKDINNYIIYLPKNKEIQSKISNLLIKIDKEIELQQKLLEQYKLRQKSLMQLLLTGIVRVG